MFSIFRILALVFVILTSALLARSDEVKALPQNLEKVIAEKSLGLVQKKKIYPQQCAVPDGNIVPTGLFGGQLVFERFQKMDGPLAE